MKFEDTNMTREEYSAIEVARGILDKHLVRPGQYFTQSEGAKEYFRMHIGGSKREHFMAVFLHSDMSLISGDVMFSGTTGRCAVEPVEIVRRALALGSSHVIIAHNHPCGDATPTDDDLCITGDIIAQLEVFDIKMLDHIIVGSECISFANLGYL
jgi:DNA repair protein RadC